MSAPLKNNFVPGMSQPSLRALAEAGYKVMEDLVHASEKEVSRLHGMGPKGVRLLKQGMKKLGLSFKK